MAPQTNTNSSLSTLSAFLSLAGTLSTSAGLDTLVTSPKASRLPLSPGITCSLLDIHTGTTFTKSYNLYPFQDKLPFHVAKLLPDETTPIILSSPTNGGTNVFISFYTERAARSPSLHSLVLKVQDRERKILISPSSSLRQRNGDYWLFAFPLPESTPSLTVTVCYTSPRNVQYETPQIPLTVPTNALQSLNKLKPQEFEYSPYVSGPNLLRDSQGYVYGFELYFQPPQKSSARASKVEITSLTTGTYTVSLQEDAHVPGRYTAPLPLWAGDSIKCQLYTEALASPLNSADVVTLSLPTESLVPEYQGTPTHSPFTTTLIKENASAFVPGTIVAQEYTSLPRLASHLLIVKNLSEQNTTELWNITDDKGRNVQYWNDRTNSEEIVYRILPEKDSTSLTLTCGSISRETISWIATPR